MVWEMFKKFCMPFTTVSAVMLNAVAGHQEQITESPAAAVILSHAE